MFFPLLCFFTSTHHAVSTRPPNIEPAISLQTLQYTVILRYKSSYYPLTLFVVHWVFHHLYLFLFRQSSRRWSAENGCRLNWSVKTSKWWMALSIFPLQAVMQRGNSVSNEFPVPRFSTFKKSEINHRNGREWCRRHRTSKWPLLRSVSNTMTSLSSMTAPASFRWVHSLYFHLKCTDWMWLWEWLWIIKFWVHFHFKIACDPL